MRLLLIALYKYPYLLTYKRSRPHLHDKDTQIYEFCQPPEWLVFHDRISKSTDDVASCTRSNRLQLNSAKTAMVWTSASQRLYQLLQQLLPWGGTDEVTPVAVVRDQNCHLHRCQCHNKISRHEYSHRLHCSPASAPKYPLIDIPASSSVTNVNCQVFLIATARIWNDLLDQLVTSAPSLTVFCSRLKTYLSGIHHSFWLL